jgi:hypothetical protein
MNTKGVLVLTSGVALISIVATLYLTAGNPPPKTTAGPKASDKHVVEFRVEKIASPSKLEITTAGASSCAKKGCFKIKNKNSGEITFNFTAPDDKWQLTEFKICKGTDKTSLDCKLTLWERLEFFGSQDLLGTNLLVTNLGGSIDLTSLLPGSRTFYLFDQNAINQKYFYQIKACHPSNSPPCIETDPPIVNKGRN